MQAIFKMSSPQRKRRKYKSEDEAKIAKRARDRERMKTKVSIPTQYERWKRYGEVHHLNNNDEIAKKLLDR